MSESDNVVLILDTYNDEQNGFVFGTTPAGIEYDGQVANEGQGTGRFFGGGLHEPSTVPKLGRGGLQQELGRKPARGEGIPRLQSRSRGVADERSDVSRHCDVREEHVAA